MSEYVTDEMVKRGGDALHADACPYDGECACGGDFDREARIVLEAAAPLIAAQAWDEGYAEGGRGRMWDSINPYCADAREDHR